MTDSNPPAPDGSGAPKSLLLLNESLIAGGAERQLSHLANHLAGIGHKVRLVTWASTEAADGYSLSAEVERIHLRNREGQRSKFSRMIATGRAWLKLVGLLRRIRPDAIVSFSEASNALALPAARLARRPLIVSIRTNPIAILAMHPHWRRPAIATYRRSDMVVAQTRAVADWCRRECGRDAAVVPNMIRNLPIPPPASERHPVIIAVGSLFRYKGHDILIRAFAAIHRDHPEWRVVVMGGGPEQAALEDLAQQLGVRAKIDFKGFVPDVEGALGTGSIFVLPSRFEGFPNALIEAMAMGLAVISTDCDYGPREIVDHGENGMLVPVQDPAALGAALRLLIADAPFRQEIAARAQEVRTRYSGQAVMAEWDAVIDKVTDAGLGRAAARGSRP